MPVWHVSLSLWTPNLGRIRAPGRLERAGVALLAGVGGDREWWIWNPQAQVGHLRVQVTPGEHALIPAGMAEHDAGPAGPERRRTRPRTR
jgi:hypothetical protein